MSDATVRTGTTAQGPLLRPQAAGAVHRVLITDTSEVVTCSSGQNVLAGMEQLGRKGIPVGCRGGGCGVCKVRVLTGEYDTGRMSRAYVSQEEQGDGVALACKLYPKSDLELQVLGKMLRAVTSIYKTQHMAGTQGSKPATK